ncbi:MAG TPA: type II secretion system F family protein, partial [Armatimonadota bacterium]|nr:type II secretion system F family protein [Armatimonadota bacterium]
MATFSYVARDQLGKIQQGTADAENEQILYRKLRERGLWVQSIERTRAGKAPEKKAAPGVKAEGKKKRIGKVKARDLTMFCRQFATMINAGVSLVRCLAVLEMQASAPSLKAVIREVQYSVEGGETLTRALSRFPHIFSNLFIGLVRAGEVGGVLDETLERLATFLEEDMKLKRKVKAAMTYPAIVMSLAVGIVIFLVTFIVPKFIQLFADFNLQMPAPTMFLISCSKFLTNPVNVIVLVVTIVVLSIAINRFRATKTGKAIWDKMMLKVP